MCNSTDAANHCHNAVEFFDSRYLKTLSSIEDTSIVDILILGDPQLFKNYTTYFEVLLLLKNFLKGLE